MNNRTVRCQGVIFHDDQVVLLRHYNPVTEKFYWWFPGGGQEEDETPEQAAIREVFEETTLVVRSEGLLFEMPDPERKFTYETYLGFLCTPLRGVLAVGHENRYLGQQILHEARWFPLWDEHQWPDDVQRPSTCIYRMLRLAQSALASRKNL